MPDNRYKSFLTVFETLNYRQAALQLHLSQPAITKHIQSLEEEFQVPLFTYKAGKLHISPQAQVLRRFILSADKNYQDLLRELHSPDQQTLAIGFTKTIGHFRVGQGVQSFLTRHPVSLQLYVDNTASLLAKLQAGQLDFVVIEGTFHKAHYDYQRLDLVPFTGICHRDHPFAGGNIDLDQVFDETLILREEGSGSRQILLDQLSFSGYDLSQFKALMISNSLVMTQDLLVRKLGIAFAYEDLALSHPNLTTFQVEGISRMSEYNIVSLKHSQGLEWGRAFFSED